VLASLEPAPFGGAHLMVGSDYSGAHESSDYWVYSFLLSDADTSPSWPGVRRDVRAEFLSDGRRMSFKRLGDRQRLAALRPFLAAADLFNGVCVGFVVRKGMHRLSTGARTLEVWTRLHGVHGKWDDESFEAMVRIVHLFSMLIGRWTTRGTHVTWITDQDRIAANDPRLDDMLAFAGKMTSVYVDRPMGELAINTTGIDDAARGFEDFVAVADLVAGALAETVTQWSRQPGWSHGTELSLLPSALSPKSKLLAHWFWSGAERLRKYAMLIDKTPDGRGYVSHMDIDVGGRT
jgi:hypothetical protein